MTFQDKLYTLFEEPEKSKASFMLNTFIYVLIFISILNLMFLSVESIRKEYGDIIVLIRNIIMPIFVVEYIFRVYASGSLKKYKGIWGES